jgi:HSP20 family molecular chaperone IbpA
VEIAYGMFRRVVTLPADVDPENIEAQYNSGILEITIPRLPQHHHSIKVSIS